MVTTQLYIFHDLMTNLCKLKSPWLKISVHPLYLDIQLSPKTQHVPKLSFHNIFSNLPISTNIQRTPRSMIANLYWGKFRTSAMLTESGPKWEREVHSYMQRKMQPLPLWRWQFVEEMMSGMECLKKQYTIEHGFWKKYPTSCLSLLLKAPFISIVCLFVFRENG